MATLAKALVLGTRTTATLIGNQLKNEGISVEFLRPEHVLPLPSHPDAVRQMKMILSQYNVDWVHPGTSVWADRVELAAVVRELGKIFIGPPIRILNEFSNRLNFLISARDLGVSTLLLSDEPLHSLAELEKLILRKKLKLPIVLKAVKCERSAGVFVLHNASMLRTELPTWLDQMRHLLGEVIFFVEKHIEGARHLSIPFCRQSNGDLFFFPFIDISLQIHGRRLIEIFNAFVVDSDVRLKIEQTIKILLNHYQYSGVGSFEFLVDGSRFFLIEAEAKINLAFYFLERLKKIQLVSLQLETMGLIQTHRLSTQQQDDFLFGLGLHLYAEDPVLRLPQPGVVLEFHHPDECQLFPSEDGYLGMIFVQAESYKAAIKKAVQVLDQLWIAGSLQTNERYLFDILKHPWVHEGIFHAGFLDDEFIPRVRLSSEWMEALAFVAKNELGRSSEKSERWVVGDQWVKNLNEKVEWVNPPLFLENEGRVGVSGFLRLGEEVQRVCFFPIHDDRWEVRLGHWFYSVRRMKSKDVGPKVVSLLNGRVHSILYQAGATVGAHEPFLVIESLHQLVSHALPLDVRIHFWKVVVGEIVKKGQELAQIEVAAKN